MKKVLFAGVMLLGLAVSASAVPLLVEAYQEGTITIPAGESDELTVVEVSFSVDSACYAQFATGEIAQTARIWLELDGDSLPPRALCGDYYYLESLSIVYTYLLEPGEHTISLRLSNYRNSDRATSCRNAYLQALIFLPDTATGAVAEQPMSDAEPAGATPSLISSGPYVNVAGATELVDATGRIIENAISDDKVFISNLPTGTYFARDEDRTVVKIVKVQ